MKSLDLRCCLTWRVYCTIWNLFLINLRNLKITGWFTYHLDPRNEYICLPQFREGQGIYGEENGIVQQRNDLPRSERTGKYYTETPCGFCRDSHVLHLFSSIYLNHKFMAFLGKKVSSTLFKKIKVGNWLTCRCCCCWLDDLFNELCVCLKTIIRWRLGAIRQN